MALGFRMTLNTIAIYALLISLSILAGASLFAWWRQKRTGRALPFLSSATWQPWFELAVIGGWALWVAGPLLNTPASAVPRGGEFSNLVQTHFIWTMLPRCGVCFLWNGFINGGAPAFAELLGPVLHPLVFAPVLAWGVIQGAKITFALSLALAGFAQWKLARALRLGVWARLWGALLVVVSGHLAGRMENGDVGLALGEACAALVLAYGVDLFYNRNRRSLAWFSLSLALTLLSGAGYIQITAALTLLPMLGIFCLFQGSQARSAWMDYLQALGLAALLCGIFLIPMLHFLPNIGKEVDPSLSNFPPLGTMPLLLVINDMEFYRSQILGKDPWLATHLIYVGWGAVALAVLALRLAPRRLNRLMVCFFGGIVAIFLVTSYELPHLLQPWIPAIGALRHLTDGSGLVVPLVIGLASISLDALLKWLSTALAKTAARVQAHAITQTAIPPIASVLVMIPFALLTITQAYQLSQQFMDVREIDYVVPLVDQLKTPTAQWVQPPVSYYDWTVQALLENLKIGFTWRPWFWKNRQYPPSQVSAISLTGIHDAISRQQKAIPFHFSKDISFQYASVNLVEPGQPAVPCPATSQGGWIDVTCTTNAAGVLMVYENAWDGWYAWVDGTPAALAGGQWLQVEAPGGTHHYRFRYLPWDVPLGALLTLAGVVLWARLHWHTMRAEHQPSEPTQL